MEKNDAIAIYQLFLNQEYNYIVLHRQCFQHFMTLITAVLGATITAIQYFKDNEWILLAICIGPIINFLLLISAINRFHIIERHI